MIKKLKNWLTFSGFPVEATSGRGSFLAAIEFAFGGAPCQWLGSGEHHDVGGWGGSSGAPESCATGVRWLEHTGRRAAEREHDVRALVLSFRLDASLAFLVLTEDRLAPLSFRLPYQSLALLYLASSVIFFCFFLLYDFFSYQYLYRTQRMYTWCRENTL